jgi:hypothetical protein
MRRRPMAVRRGPGLVGTMARTAVIAGTATAVSSGVMHHQQGKAQAQQAQADAQQQQVNEQQQVADMQEQMNAMQAQQAQAAIAGTPAPAAVAPATDMAGQLQQLASMKASGILTDEEFQAAKAKLLAAG